VTAYFSTINAQPRNISLIFTFLQLSPYNSVATGNTTLPSTRCTVESRNIVCILS